MSSVRRKAGESPYTALNREDVVALLFVTKVPASEVPAADTENKNEAKVRWHTQHALKYTTQLHTTQGGARERSQHACTQHASLPTT